MKLAVTSQGDKLESPLDQRFGRAKWIIVFDTETGNWQAHGNEVNLTAIQGAGIQTGSNIVNLGADAVITGNVGPNAFRVLREGNAEVFLSGPVTVSEAIEAWKNDKLKQVSSANVEGHWL
jgi:predicted Fe-Mo cluster-binding NifX family protein